MKYFCRFCNKFIANNDGVLVHDDVLHPLEYVYRDDSQEPFAYYLNSPHGILFLEREKMTSNHLTLEWAGKLAWKPLYTHPAKTLTDEEINKLWAKSHEDGIAMQHGFTTQQHYFAHLILRKDSEK